MKKISKYALSATVALSIFAQNAFAANNNSQAICDLLDKFGTVIGTIRTLAFIGAAFMIMEWAWTYISDPGKLTKADIKDKGLGMLVGFTLLLGVGFVLSFIMSSTGKETIGCVVNAFK